MNTQSSFPEPSQGAADLEAVARLLIAHARRDDAVALVREVAACTGDRAAFLLLARIQLESGKKEDAAAAAAALDAYRSEEPRDLEAIVLLREALQVLGRARGTTALDREVRWAGGVARRVAKESA